MINRTYETIVRGVLKKISNVLSDHDKILRRHTELRTNLISLDRKLIESLNPGKDTDDFLKEMRDEVDAIALLLKELREKNIDDIPEKILEGIIKDLKDELFSSENPDS